jgi:hypothetical protein
VSRQFTDGEIVAAIRAIAAEGAPLSRATVRKRLGGGGSTRISAILKEYGAGSHGPAPRSGPAVRSGPVLNSGSASKAGPLAGAPLATPVPIPVPQVDHDAESGVSHLESEIRVLKILLESERNARREEEARYARTIQALQREIELASRGAARPSGGAPEQRPKPRS